MVPGPFPINFPTITSLSARYEKNLGLGPLMVVVRVLDRPKPHKREAYRPMHKHFTWIAIFCSLVAGTFAAEFVSSLGKLPVDDMPTHVMSPHDNDFPAKIAFSETGVDFGESLKN